MEGGPDTHFYVVFLHQAHKYFFKDKTQVFARGRVAESGNLILTS